MSLAGFASLSLQMGFGQLTQFAMHDPGYRRSLASLAVRDGAGHEFLHTYAEGTARPAVERLDKHSRIPCLFGLFSGVPRLLVPDSLRTGVRVRACRYDPDLNPTYQEFAMHAWWESCRRAPSSERQGQGGDSACQLVRTLDHDLLPCATRRFFGSQI